MPSTIEFSESKRYQEQLKKKPAKIKKSKLNMNSRLTKLQFADDLPSNEHDLSLSFKINGTNSEFKIVEYQKDKADLNGSRLY